MNLKLPTFGNIIIYTIILPLAKQKIELENLDFYLGFLFISN